MNRICPIPNEIYTASNGFRYFKNSAGTIRRIEHKYSMTGAQITKRQARRLIRREMFAVMLNRAHHALTLTNL